ncbi:MAG TPA: LamG domain-containing protein [Trebonia sp.]
MTDSQSEAAHKTTPPGDATHSGVVTKLPAGGTPGVREPGQGARPRMGKKSALTLGGIIAVAIVTVALSATARLSLSSDKTTITAAAGPSASASASVPGTAAGKAAPVVSKSAAPHKAPSKHPGAPAGLATAAPTPAVATAPAAGSPRSHPATKPTTVSMPEPVSWWPLDDRTGTIAVDTMGAHSGTASNINWCIPQYGSCAAFNGTDSDIVTSGPVLDTAPGSSFTVSAVIDLTTIAPNDASETIVSQDSTYDSGFYLQYSGTDQRWAFARVVSDTDQGPAANRALSTSGPTLNTWTHLVGVYDASDDQMRLYVNGVLESTVTDTTPFAATGPLAIGRAQFDGQPTDWFTGATGEIAVYNVALTSAQVAKTPPA